MLCAFLMVRENILLIKDKEKGKFIKDSGNWAGWAKKNIKRIALSP